MRLFLAAICRWAGTHAVVVAVRDDAHRPADHHAVAQCRLRSGSEAEHTQDGLRGIVDIVDPLTDFR
ncbi:hypothetical protein [Streptomyces sp. NPDC056255]|uniref:hypothetical protein n=1 Tax=Streptomyces sp. NPDC056255 TaxID=3345764 RepID=UPI0035DABAF5